MKHKFVLPVIFAAALGLTACGGDKKDGAATTTTTTTTVPVAEPQPVPVEPAQPAQTERGNGISIRTNDGSLSIGDDGVAIESGDTEISVKTDKDPD